MFNVIVLCGKNAVTNVIEKWHIYRSIYYKICFICVGKINTLI